MHCARSGRSRLSTAAAACGATCWRLPTCCAGASHPIASSSFDRKQNNDRSHSTMTVMDAPIDTAVSPLRRLTRLLTSQQNLYAVLKSAAQVLAIRLLGAGLTYASMVL